MWLPRATVLLILFGLVYCETEEDETSKDFMEAARNLFDRDTLGGFQGVASAFVESDAGKQVGDILTGGKSDEIGVGQVISGLGSLLSSGQNRQGVDFSALASIFDTLSGSTEKRRSGRKSTVAQGFDIESVVNFASAVFSQKANSDMLLGVMPMVMDGISAFMTGGEPGDGPRDKHDHSGHAWFLPPVLEHIHVMWEHFSNSEFGQALWKNSGLNKIVAQMTDQEGHIEYEKILDSFDNPTLRRRWIKSLTNFVAEWISHISDPMIQQRYLTTAQFVGNSFLKSQGFPKSAMFDATRPTESLSRMANAVVKRHLGMKFDSSQYIKPAVAYVQELINLASEKGFIMSRVNAWELSNKLSDMINNDIVGPILKAYRAYKWAAKRPECANQILCTINEKTSRDDDSLPLRKILAKISSFPAAWAVSQKTGMNFWSLYGAISEREPCLTKYPAECSAFHEEELRVTTESTHSEL